MNTTPDRIETNFTKLFDVRYPIIGAPMFLVSDEDMVVAMSESGGIGTFPALNFKPISRYRQAIQTIKGRTSNPFGINIIVQKSNRVQNEQLDILLEEEVPLIITSLGSPKDVIKRAKETGGKTKVFCDVVGLEHAKKVEDYGADGLIAVSAGAGGHAGDTSPFALIPYLKKNTKLPIVAAGSIVDGIGMLAAFSLGASAIYMGTRIIASTESKASDEYKNAIVKSGCEKIVNTDRVDGFPGNFILTDLLKEHGLEAPFIEQVANRSKKLKRAISLVRAGRSLFGNPESKASYKNIFSAGHGVGMIDSVESIDHIVQKTVKQYRDLKPSLPV